VKELIGLKKTQIHHEESIASKSEDHSHKKPKRQKPAKIDVEEVSVDSDGDSLRKSSSRGVPAQHQAKVEPHREEWEEDLTST
jgi:hypothetical protein